METDALLDEVERRIEALRDTLEGCRQAILLSRAAAWLGIASLALVFTVAGSYRTAPVVFGALTAIIGGTVWSGASRSSRDEAKTSLAAAEARRAALIDGVSARNGWRDLTPSVH